MTSVKTTCPYCGVGCGVIASADGTIKGDPDHPSNFGRLCSKGSALGETLDLEGRLLAPQIGDRTAGWNEALDLVADKFRAAIDAYGPDSVAFYVSGQLLTEDYYVANKLMKGYIGSANIDTNSRLCMASSVAGHKRAFGTDTVPGTYEDLETADTIVLVGSNLAWCHPVLFQRVVAAKAANPNMRVVNIDPRRTATSDLADLHLSIAPDGDSALFNGLLAEIAARGAVNHAYLTHVDGFDAALDATSSSDPNASGLSPKDIQEFYDIWLASEKTVTIYSQGVNQSVAGSDKVNAILNCHLATGRIGRPGMGPFSVTGQPNAMGGREVGGLANMLANHLDLENADHRATVQSAWNAPTMADHAGLKAVDLFNACADGKIKALWIMSTNPAVSMPDAGRVAEAIKSVPFTVVSDIMARTDTTELADVILPATGWGEKSGTVTNSERRISRQRPFLSAPGQTRPDWEIICDVATRMGWGDAFNFTSAAEVFDEYAQLSIATAIHGKDFDISGLAGMSSDEYDAMTPVQWPVPANGTPGGRFFDKGAFYHLGGKAKMLPITPPPPKRHEFTLNTGRIRDQWHTMTRTAKAPRLNQHLAEPFAEIHPEDAFAMGVQPAEIMDITTKTGTARVRALITTRVQKSHIFVPMHWTAQNSNSGLINRAVTPTVDPTSGQPASKNIAADVTRFNAGWYGFAASVNPVTSNRPYVATIKTNTGYQGEIAGVKAPQNWETEARETLGLPHGNVAIYQDTATGHIRIAITENDILTGVFFAGPTPVAAARAHVVAAIGTKTPAQMILAGVPSQDQPDPGATVCSCMNVGINTLRAAIAKGADSVDKLGECTGAGTNCGSCKPEIAALLVPQTTKVAAE